MKQESPVTQGVRMDVAILVIGVLAFIAAVAFFAKTQDMEEKRQSRAIEASLKSNEDMAKRLKEANDEFKTIDDRLSDLEKPKPTPTPAPSFPTRFQIELVSSPDGQRDLDRLRNAQKNSQHANKLKNGLPAKTH